MIKTWTAELAWLLLGAALLGASIATGIIGLALGIRAIGAIGTFLPLLSVLAVSASRRAEQR